MEKRSVIWFVLVVVIVLSLVSYKLLDPRYGLTSQARRRFISDLLKNAASAERESASRYPDSEKERMRFQRGLLEKGKNELLSSYGLDPAEADSILREAYRKKWFARNGKDL